MLWPGEACMQGRPTSVTARVLWRAALGAAGRGAGLARRRRLQGRACSAAGRTGRRRRTAARQARTARGTGTSPARNTLRRGTAPARAAAAVTGTVLDVSPHVLIGPRPKRAAVHPDRRADGLAGRPAEPAALERATRVMVRLLPPQRSGRPDLGQHRPRHRADHRAGRRRQFSSTRARPEAPGLRHPGPRGGRIQVRFPSLEPGYLIDVIGLRRGGAARGPVPATSQPAYRGDRVPAAPRAVRAVPGTASAAQPPGTSRPSRAPRGVAYPALDPAAGAAEAAAGRAAVRDALPRHRQPAGGPQRVHGRPACCR